MIRLLRFRETDRFVSLKARVPLSVSSDRIPVTAMRCVSLLDQFGDGRRISRRGDDQIVEVYPGAALVLWSDEASDLRLDANGYKGRYGEAKRNILVKSLADASPWLNWDDIADTCIDNDDSLDAVLSSLVARAAALGLTIAPPAAREEVADIEGWIHLPESAGLRELPRQ